MGCLRGRIGKLVRVGRKVCHPCGGLFVFIKSKTMLTLAQISAVIGLLVAFGVNQGTVNNVQAILQGQKPTSPVVMSVATSTQSLPSPVVIINVQTQAQTPTPTPTPVAQVLPKTLNVAYEVSNNSHNWKVLNRFVFYVIVKQGETELSGQEVVFSASDLDDTTKPLKVDSSYSGPNSQLTYGIGRVFQNDGAWHIGNRFVYEPNASSTATSRTVTFSLKDDPSVTKSITVNYQFLGQ